MGTEGYHQMTPEEIKSAKMKEGEMLRNAAEVDETGQLVATERQIDEVHKEMENKLYLKPYF